MYHCHIHFYLAGNSRQVFEIIKEMPPFEYFTHEFWESERPESALTAKADMILADLRDIDVQEALPLLIAEKSEKAELI